MTEGKILMFNRWDSSNVEVSDPGLRGYINLKPIIVPRSGGKYATVSFHKNDMSIVERFMNKLFVTGHKGRKHKLTSGHNTGNSATLYREIKKAFESIEKKTNKNPLQVLVDAIISGATYEEVTAYRLGGTIARKAVVTAPQRRLDLSLRLITQGIYRATFKNKTPLHEVIARELIAIANNDVKTFAVRERTRIEKEAEGAR